MISNLFLFLKSKFVNIIIIGACFSLMFFTSCTKNNQPKNDSLDSFGERCDLIVCEKKQADKNAFYLNYSYQDFTGKIVEDYCMQLPLITILKELGANVEDRGDGNFKITTLEGSSYSLSLGEKELKENYSKYNMIEVAPGTTHFCCLILNNEMYLDSTTLTILIYDVMGIRLDVSLDLNSKSIEIKTR